MLKEIVKRGSVGFLLGVFSINVIALVNSSLFGNGSFSLVTTYLIKQCGSEILASWFFFFLSGFIGALYGITSLIFENEKMNLVMQTFLHAIISAPLTFVVGWVCYWMPHNLTGILIFAAEYVVIYVIIWLSFYLSYKHKVNQVNEKLKEREE